MMALPRVLFAGDSNLKFVQGCVPATDGDQLKVLSVSGASVVRDGTGFYSYLEEAVTNFRPEEMYLHLGSNDVSRRTSPRRVYWELRDLIHDMLVIVPDLRVTLCSVLPRSTDRYRDVAWNRQVLPEIQRRVEQMNMAIQDLCRDLHLTYVEYHVDQKHFGRDGLHVKPSGAKQLLFTILGMVKRTCFVPDWCTPCTGSHQESVGTFCVDEWPALPTITDRPAVETSIEPVLTAAEVVKPKKEAVTNPVCMPYPRVSCDVVFGWDDKLHEQAHKMVESPTARRTVVAHDEPTMKKSDNTRPRACTDEKAVVGKWKKQGHKQGHHGKMYSVKDLESNGMLKLDICGVETYVKPSAYGGRTGLYGGAKNVKKTAEKSGKAKRLNLNAAREYLLRVCTSGNERNLQPDGPYGDICQLLSGLSNSKMNRKRLQTIWFWIKKSAVHKEEDVHIPQTGKSGQVKTRSVTKTSKVSAKKGTDRFDIPKKDLSLLDNSTWLSSDHINVYMSLLARESVLKVHPVNSVWYSQRLVKDSDPQRLQWVFHQTESKSKWFDFDYILIPINENGSHWTIAIVQVKEKTIIYCDSLLSGDNANINCHQIWRYLCYEALIHSGLILKKTDWSILHYDKFPGFPVQTDGSRCGVYVCAVAKAILFNRSLPCEPNLSKFRKSIAGEISEMSLYF